MLDIMNELKRLEKLALEYDKDQEVSITQCVTNKRLIGLVEKYGVERVSVASGLKPSSVVLYTSRSKPPRVSEATVKKAEYVLKQR